MANEPTDCDEHHRRMDHKHVRFCVCLHCSEKEDEEGEEMEEVEKKVKEEDVKVGMNWSEGEND